MTEIWKDIEGYDGKYQVSNLGRVRSVDHIGLMGGFNKDKTKLYHGRILKPCNTRGYLAIGIKGKTFTIHRLVAHAFVSGYFEGAEVNHIDENKHNNVFTNLEWVTHEHNMKYGNCISKMKQSSQKSRGIKIEQYTNSGKFICEYPSIREAARKLKVSDTRIGYVLNNNGTVRGYILKRKK